ncbi:MAG: hypothetical protein HZB99_01850 [Candidatus Harrisonbacteria bacterium]|nr:hypothetical protein [Candidatus Harrisonbacteria bacterium]
MIKRLCWALLINGFWLAFIALTIKWQLPHSVFLTIWAIFFLITFFTLWLPDDNGGGWNDGGDDNPKVPDPDPNDTKKIIEDFLCESRKKTKNPVLK